MLGNRAVAQKLEMPLAELKKNLTILNWGKKMAVQESSDIRISQAAWGLITFYAELLC